jgi:SET domain-containing protein
MSGANFFNHSCMRNVVQHAVRLDNFILYTATRDIVAGEELFISYVALKTPKELKHATAGHAFRAVRTA